MRDSKSSLKIEKTRPVPEVFYTPDSSLRQPGQLVRAMGRDLLAGRELAWRLFVRNIKAQYRQSLLGYLWAFLPPIFTTLVWVYLNSQKILNVGETEIPYPAYVLVGTLLWAGFTDSLNKPLGMVTSSAAMLSKINFPREALLLAGMGDVVFNFGIRLILLVGVIIFFKLPLTAAILLAPIGILALMALGLTLGLLVAPLGTLYGDVGRGLGVLTTLWFYFTPVVYNPPTTWPGSLISQINPVAPLLITTRAWLTGGEVGDLTGFWVVLAATLVLFFAGWVLFRLAMPYLIERMNA